MPAVSERQRRAMWAAAEGSSKLGIPESVGKEFVKNDSEPKPSGGELSDWETIEAMRDGELTSPQKYGDFWIFDMRITGTGVAYRDSIGEFAIRDADKWLSDEFVKRCGGLAVIFDHPEKSGLNHEEFKHRSAGQIVLPYVKGDEVWGIAKIFDADAAEMIEHGGYISTSPGVTTSAGSEIITLEDGTRVLDEDLPLVLDHLAICKLGVWDKNGPAEGIRLDSSTGVDLHDPASEENTVTPEEKAALEKERDDAKTRADAAEAKVAEFEKDAKTRKDAEEASAAEKEREDKKRKDAKAKHDSEEHEGEMNDCSRCDGTETEEEKKEREDAKRKRDAAASADVEAGRGTEIKDMKKDLHDAKLKNTELEAAIAEIRAGQAPLPLDEANALASSYARFDQVFQSIAEVAPMPLPGERAAAYEKRSCDKLRPFTKNFKNYVFHDAQQATDFGLVRDAIVDEVAEYAKNPPSGSLEGRLIEIKDTQTLPGKVITRFQGDQNVGWGPFEPPVRRWIRSMGPDKKTAAQAVA